MKIYFIPVRRIFFSNDLPNHNYKLLYDTIFCKNIAYFKSILYNQNGITLHITKNYLRDQLNELQLDLLMTPYFFFQGRLRCIIG